MKKFLCAVLVLAALVSVATAEMDDVTFTHSVSGALLTTNAAVVRGNIVGVSIIAPNSNPTGLTTGSVSVTSIEQGTIFSKSGITGSTNYYPILASMYSTAGAAITDKGWDGTNVSAIGAAPIYGKLPVASKVTSVVTAASTGATNTWKVILVVEK